MSQSQTSQALRAHKKQNRGWYDLPPEIRKEILSYVANHRKIVLTMRRSQSSDAFVYAYKVIDKYPQRFMISRDFCNEVSGFGQVTHISAHPVPTNFSNSVNHIAHAAQPYLQNIQKVTIRMGCQTLFNLCWSDVHPMHISAEESLPRLLGFIGSMRQLQVFEIKVDDEAQQRVEMAQVLLPALVQAHTGFDRAVWREEDDYARHSVLELIAVGGNTGSYVFYCGQDGVVQRWVL